MEISYEAKGQNYQKENTIYWFDVCGESWGVSDTKGERKLVDSENNHYDDVLLFEKLNNMITEEIAQV
jgi:hypothetical protein